VVTESLLNQGGEMSGVHHLDPPSRASELISEARVFHQGFQDVFQLVLSDVVVVAKVPTELLIATAHGEHVTFPALHLPGGHLTLKRPPIQTLDLEMPTSTASIKPELVGVVSDGSIGASSLKLNHE
jgi:hypothetical protein